MNRSRRIAPRGGFTLMEVLIAIALLLALFSAMFSFLYDMLTTRARVLELTGQQRAASLLIDRIEADLLVCVVGDAHHGAGVQGDEQSLRLLSRGMLPGGAFRSHVGSGEDSGRQPTADSREPSAFHDLQRSEYRFDPSSHALTGARVPADEQSPDAHSFGDRLYKVRFRYHDGTDWRPAYDSLEQNRLPVAVEVAIWFDPWPGDEWSEDEADAAVNDRGESPERLTFDMEDTFDEREWAMRADRDMRDEPMPDRVRVILIPDAGEDES